MFKAKDKPIPLELLSVSIPGSNTSTRAKRASSILPYSRSATVLSNSSGISPKSSTSETLLSNKSSSYPITFYHHGRKGSPPLTLYTSGAAIRRSWIEKIKEQQKILDEKRRVFAIRPLLKRQFQLNNKVNSSEILCESLFVIW